MIFTEKLSAFFAFTVIQWKIFTMITISTFDCKSNFQYLVFFWRRTDQCFFCLYIKKEFFPNQPTHPPK